MVKMTDKLRELINDAQRILITSHISPDPDAFSSLLLFGTTLLTNFPDKKVAMVMEEAPIDLEFLYGYEQVEFLPLIEALNKHRPDTFVLLDGNNYERCSRHNGAAVRQYIADNKVKTVTIDHHEQAGKDEVDIFINRNSPATAQTVYEVLLKEMELKKPEQAPLTAMVGFYADTGGFVYLKDGQQEQTFDFAKELLMQGVDLEEIKNKLLQFTTDDMKTLAELMANVACDGDYTYSFIRDEYISEWLKSGKTQAQLQRATGIFLDEFIRNIDGRKWGFIVYKNTLQGDDIYSVSLRAVSGVRDVSLVANILGGGGHKPAAGAKVEAKSANHAITKVRQAILVSER